VKKVIGLDLGDKKHVAVVFDADGVEHVADGVSNTVKQVAKYFERHAGAVVVMEAGTHSGWISRLLEGMGHEVWVGNPRKLRVIWDSPDKSDARDARVLGLMFRLEPRLLHRVHHRGEQAQCDLALIKSRGMLVETRTKLINHVRCIVKGMGVRVSASSAESFHKKALTDVPVVLWDALGGVVEQIKQLTAAIREMDTQVERMCAEKYPETQRLTQVSGVGSLTALAFVLTVEDPKRFTKSRSVGPFLGLTPRRDQSGETDKQLAITKAGDVYLRQLLVGCAHYILGPFGKECDLRTYGERIAAQGAKNAKKRAVVAVARKLAVLLHRLWTDGREYVPVRKAAEEGSIFSRMEPFCESQRSCEQPGLRA
jgi:transposase